MLVKSRRSALILSAAGVLAFTLTSILVNLVLPYLLSKDRQAVFGDPARLSRPADILALAIVFLAALAALIAIGGYWLHRFFGPAYFGRRGLWRWGLFGALLAILIKVPDWILPSSWWLARYLLLFLGVFLAFFTARRVVPLER